MNFRPVDKPTHFAIVDCINNTRYVLVRYSHHGFSKYDTYGVFPVIFGRIERNRMTTIKAFRSKLKKYAPYIFNNMTLIVYGISAGLISPSQEKSISAEELDTLFIAYKKDYNDALIDTNLAIGP